MLGGLRIAQQNEMYAQQLGLLLQSLCVSSWHSDIVSFLMLLLLMLMSAHNLLLTCMPTSDKVEFYIDSESHQRVCILGKFVNLLSNQDENRLLFHHFFLFIKILITCCIFQAHANLFSNLEENQLSLFILFLP